jgi:hypothetical protein
MSSGWKEERPARGPAQAGGRPVSRKPRPAASPWTGTLEELASRLDEPQRRQAQGLLRSADFRAGWAAWIAMRQEEGHACTERTLKSALKLLADLHPNPLAAWNVLDHSTDNAWQGLHPRPRALWRPLPSLVNLVGKATAAAGGGPAKAGTPTASAADLAALEDYKLQAEGMTPAERADLGRKVADALPHLSGSFAAAVWRMNEEDRKRGMADGRWPMGKGMRNSGNQETAQRGEW